RVRSRRADALAGQLDLLTVKWRGALAQRESRRAGVDPEAGELLRVGVEANEARAGRLAAGIGKDEVGLQELSVVDHFLCTPAPGDGRLAAATVEGLHNVPLSDKLCQELLTFARLRSRLVRGLRIAGMRLSPGRLDVSAARDAKPQATDETRYA